MIAVSMRVHQAYADERWDAIDQRWPSLIEEWGHEPVAVGNSLSSERLRDIVAHADGVVLTGGNDLAALTGARNPAPERDATEALLLDLAMAHDLPALGICRGAQLMVTRWGGRLVPSRGHHHAGGHQIRFTGRLTARAPCWVNSYHRWAIPDTAPDVEALAVCEVDQTIESFEIPKAGFVGIVWHPERRIDSGDAALLKELFTARLGRG